MSRIPILCATVFALLLVGIPAAGEPLPKKAEDVSGIPRIPAVTSIGALDALAPIFTLDGWDVRLALAPAEFPKAPSKPGVPPDFSAQPWRLLYADLRRIEKGAEFPEKGGDFGGERLGPFRYTLDYKPDGPLRKVLPDLIKEVEMMELLREDADRFLFAATIPTTGTGEYKIRIFAPTDGRRVEDHKKPDPQAIATWKQKGEIAATWVQFAAAQYVDLPDLGIPVPDKMVSRFVPAAPGFDDHASLFGIGDLKKEDPIKEPLPIPGMIPSEPDPKFTIALAGAGISIRMLQPASTSSDHFLARWWIDDKLQSLGFDELPALEPELEVLKRLERLYREDEAFVTRIPFTLPHFLKKVPPDQKIALQLLYCPNGTKRLPSPDEIGFDPEEQLEARSLRRSQLRLSNRLDFQLRDALGK